MPIKQTLLIPFIITSLAIVGNLKFSTAQADKSNSIALKKPMPSPLQDDPLKDIVIKGIEGTMVYIFVDKSDPKIYHLAVRRYNLKSNSPEIITYSIDISRFNNKQIFDAQVSPDGEKVLLKVGDAVGMLGSFNLYLLDIRSGNFKCIVQKKIRNRAILWSPNSNFITYIMGGDVLGNVNDENLELFVYDIKSDEHISVVVNNTVKNSIFWSKSNKLLFSVLPDIELNKNLLKIISRGSLTPNIYEFDPIDRKYSMIVSKGWRPVPSRDGSKIAFWGAGDKDNLFSSMKNWEYLSNYAVLSVYDVKTKQITRFGMQQGEYPLIYWAKDSKKIFTLKNVSQSPNAKCIVSERDLNTHKLKVIMKLTAKDYNSITRTSLLPQFRLIGPVSFDDRYILLTSQITGLEQEGTRYSSTTILQIVDINSGEKQDIASLRNYFKFDWQPAIQ